MVLSCDQLTHYCLCHINSVSRIHLSTTLFSVSDIFYCCSILVFIFLYKCKYIVKFSYFNNFHIICCSLHRTFSMYGRNIALFYSYHAMQLQYKPKCAVNIFWWVSTFVNSFELHILSAKLSFRGHVYRIILTTKYMYFVSKILTYKIIIQRVAHSGQKCRKKCYFLCSDHCPPHLRSLYTLVKVTSELLLFFVYTYVEGEAC